MYMFLLYVLPLVTVLLAKVIRECSPAKDNDFMIIRSSMSLEDEGVSNVPQQNSKCYVTFRTDLKAVGKNFEICVQECIILP